MFLDLAIAGGADGLVSGDRHLLDLVSAVPFEIFTPAALETMIESA
jgi:predicted nucleic acid-binding protein